MKHKNVKTGMLPISSSTISREKNQSVMFSKISNVETVSEYTLRYTESCK